MKITPYMDRLYYDMKTSSDRNEQKVEHVDIAIYVTGKLACDGFKVTVNRITSEEWIIKVLERGQ